MNAARSAMLDGARAIAETLRTQQVEDAWSDPSALRGFTVGGLAAHVTTVLASCHRCIDDPPSEEEPLPAEAYYTSFTLTDVGSDANAAVVSHGEERAVHGAAATAERFDNLLSSLEQKLESVPEDRVVHLFGLVPMRLEDFFVTRALEFSVHCDDIAASIGTRSPALSRETMDLVLGHLLQVARAHHDDNAVLRAFTRRERDHVEALRVL